MIEQDKLDFKKALEDIGHMLRGLVYDPITKSYEKVEGLKPMVNEQGVNKILQILSITVNPIVAFSNFTKEQANKMTLHICKDAIPNIAVHWKEFGIASKCDIGNVENLIFVNTLAALNRGVKQK